MAKLSQTSISKWLNCSILILPNANNMKKHAILNYYHIECLLKNGNQLYCKLIKRGFLNKIKNKNDILLLHTTSDNGINMEHCSIEDEKN